jgi:hypothetical protein
MPGCADSKIDSSFLIGNDSDLLDVKMSYVKTVIFVLVIEIDQLLVIN